MTLRITVLSFFCTIFLSISSYPLGEQAYPVQYVRQQSVPIQYQAAQQPYLQQLTVQPQYITTNPVRETASVYAGGLERNQLGQQVGPQQPTQRVAQLLLPTNVDRQVQIVF